VRRLNLQSGDVRTANSFFKPLGENELLHGLALDVSRKTHVIEGRCLKRTCKGEHLIQEEY
jgi:hypothetical protein